MLSISHISSKMLFSSGKYGSMEIVGLLHLWIALMWIHNYEYMFVKTIKLLFHVSGAGVNWVSYFHAPLSDIFTTFTLKLDYKRLLGQN